jgi:hypothetical protein
LNPSRFFATHENITDSATSAAEVAAAAPSIPRRGMKIMHSVRLVAKAIA